MKQSDSQFSDIINKYDIIFLSETWTHKDSKTDINGFSSFHFPRTFIHKKAKRSSGGIIIYYRNSLKSGIKCIRSFNDVICWIKLDKDFYHVEKDIYLCATYIPPEMSMYYKVINVNLFEKLEEDISYFSGKGQVIIMGDLNSRIANSPDFIDLDRVLPFENIDSYNVDKHLPRTSMDKIHNSFGHMFLDLLKSTRLRVLNGRLFYDKDVGKYTCMNKQGCSVIDYVCAFESDFNIFNSFNVEDFNEFSDHAPITFSLNTCLHVTAPSLENTFVYSYVQWNDSMKEQFKSDVYSQVANLQELTYSLGVEATQTEVNSVVEQFANLLHNTGKPYFEKKGIIDQRSGFVNRVHCQWFNDECKAMRQVYKTALKAFNICKSDVNRHNLCKHKLAYKQCITRNKRQFYRNEGIKLKQMKTQNPRQFWKTIKSKRQTNVSKDISPTQFYDYFKKIAHGENSEFVNENVDSFMSNCETEMNQNVYQELNKTITLDEVKAAISNLKRNKASGIDNMLNEYFIELFDVIGELLVHIFNVIFNTGNFPKIWSDGIIAPLHKKGNINDENNYRGITLLSCFGKLFTTILNCRLSEWSKQYDIVSDAQFGFKQNHSTVDAIFILHSIINQNFVNKKRLYCAFVDFSKAFDLVYLNGLWYKLINLGVTGNMIKLLMSMYSQVRSCVRHMNEITDFFTCAIGLRQGEILSPFLFSLYINELEMKMHDNLYGGITINELSIYLLFYADDTVILSNSICGLQSSLDILYDYCKEWNIHVNISKTKTIVFRKSGKTKANERWKYGDEYVENVNDFNYLGVILSYNGSFIKHEKYIADKGLKAMHCMFANLATKAHNIAVDIFIGLFDTYVNPVLSYGAQIWGFRNACEIEKVHRKFLKRLLGVNSNVNNDVIYGELGRFPLFINRYVNIVKYWFKLLYSENCILREVYLSLERNCTNSVNWVSNVKDILQRYGFNEVWMYPYSVEINTFLSLFKQRIRDTYITEWKTSIESSTRLRLYREIKDEFILENYLINIINPKIRKALTKLRCVSHSLQIEIGRRGVNRCEYRQRLCKYCNLNDIEDEFHFLLICPLYKTERISYLKQYFWKEPSMYKCVQLLKNKNVDIQINLAKYVSHAFDKRTNFQYNIV